MRDSIADTETVIEDGDEVDSAANPATAHECDKKS